MSLITTIKSNSLLKNVAHSLLFPHNEIRPRWWVRKFVNPFYHQRGKNTKIFRYARLDLLPSKPFSIGHDSVVEDFTLLNNGLGALHIGNHVFLGASNVVIGPVTIHDHVMTAQNVVISGLNHGFKNVDVAFRYQPCTTSEIIIGEGCWIGANVIITAGVQVGKFSIIAAGTVVTKNVPDYTIVAGNPARILKQYNHKSGEWEAC